MNIAEPPLDRMPGWRRAYAAFNEAGYKAGDVISVEWFETELGVEPPEMSTHQAFKKLRLKWLSEFTEFRRRLLDERQLAIWKDEDGYRVLTASEQLAVAQSESRRRLRAALRWQADMLLSTDINSLTDAERATHADALARLSRFKSFTKTEFSPAPKQITDEKDKQ